MGLVGSAVVGVGHVVPPRIVTNKDLESLMDTSDEWIRQRSGIQERRYVDEGVQGSDMALEAAQNAMKKAGWNVEDIDLIIVATLSPEHYIPGTSAFLQHKLGCLNTPAMDIRCQCTGFIYSLVTADSFIRSGVYKRVLIVGVETQSRAINFSDEGRDVAVLFGDGSGAICLEAKGNSKQGIQQRLLHADGEHAMALAIDEPGMNSMPFMSKEKVETKNFFPIMNGRLVFKHAVVRLAETVKNLCDAEGIKPSDVNHYFFHQANLRINEHVAESLEIPKERAYSNIQKYGNTSAASIPILLSENFDKIKDNDWVLIAGFGSGFTWGGVLLRWVS